MKVLVACEESQRVCLAFRSRGIEAYSCDIQDCSGGHPEYHIKGDVIPLLKDNWDLIIAFPPCTYLSKVGSPLMFNSDGSIKDKSRFEKGLLAAEFFYKIYNAPCKYIAIENPTPLKCFGLPPYNYVINPYDFGSPYKKRTCLWLKNLPGLFCTSIFNYSEPFDKARWSQSGGGVVRQKNRSKTFPGVAEAMADQWSKFIYSQKNSFANKYA